MSARFIKVCSICFIVAGTILLFSQKTFAYSNISDTISTSRPSASTPIVGDQAANATQVTVYDNKSIFLASDSAVLRPDTGQTQNVVTIASMSASNTPAAGQKILYFTGPAANTHHAGTTVHTAISAMHTIAFTTQTAVPSGGKIVITFSGSGDNSASPSASTFAFNGLSSGNVVSNPAGACNSVSISAPTITCTTNTSVSGAVTILIGCSSQSSGSCTAQVPTLINPTKSATEGTADIWKVRIQSQDASSVPISGESAIISMGIIESVQVQANVDSTLTFTITGIADATAINTSNNTGCTNSEVTNTGIPSSSTSVNLGTLGGGINIAAQRMNITTNAPNGYSLTATSSGHLINPASGYFLADTSTLPGLFFTAGTTFFGIHPCGQDVNTSNWGSGATGGGANARYAWPTQTTSLTLASDASGPIDPASPDGAGDGVTSVEYAATINSIVPGGTYTSVITYVATPTF